MDISFKAVAPLSKEALAEALTTKVPAGWIQSAPGGLATNKDPDFGGIIDSEIKTGEWFVIFNTDLPKMTGFKTRAEAFLAHAKAIANKFWL